MYRFALEELKKWKEQEEPIPLLVRGARQVGKTYLINKFAQENFENYIYINFDESPEAKGYFKTLKVQEIIEAISISINQKIVSAKTLIFLDEIQECPNAIKALRYFYEKMPGLHVVGAGSLLEFTLKSGDFSIPVGRVQYFFIQQMSFYEYLNVSNQEMILDYIHNLNLDREINPAIHSQILDSVKKYMLLGGMPKVIDKYLSTNDILEALKIQNTILLSYIDDFGKYAKASKHKYLEDILSKTPAIVGSKFKYSKVDSEVKTIHLNEAFNLLCKAGVLHKVKSASGAGLPFEAHASDKSFKALYLDIGLMQKQLGLNEEIIQAEDFHSIAAGALAEQFVGQELLAYESNYEPRKLYYWEKDGKESSAEIDYLLAISGKVLPLEVKAGKRGKLKSLHSFMKQYKSPLGIRISQNELSFEDNILSIPCYAIGEIKRIVKNLL